MEWFYRCSRCGEHYEITPEMMLCPSCSTVADDGHDGHEGSGGTPLVGILEAHWDPLFTAEIAGRLTVGDPGAILPVDARYFPSIPVGNTPLWRPERLRNEVALPKLYLKDDTANPTKSFKDRASFLVAAFARQHGIDTIVVASTGNAASSMAGVGAAAGLHVVIFVPETAPTGKLVQCLQYGATVHRVAGSYTKAFSQSLAYTREYGGLNRNTGYNPLTIEGKKTVAVEIYRDLGAVPDHVFVPTGDGVILSGVYKGFADLMEMGLSDHMPMMHAVQAEGSAAIADAFAAVRSGRIVGDAPPPFHPVEAATVADSISVDVPAAGYYAVQHLIDHEGRVHVVTDDEILASQVRLSRTTGLFAEPAAAAALAGLEHAVDEIGPEESVVLLITGSGLKDVNAAANAVGLER